MLLILLIIILVLAFGGGGGYYGYQGDGGVRNLWAGPDHFCAFLRVWRNAYAPLKFGWFWWIERPRQPTRREAIRERMLELESAFVVDDSPLGTLIGKSRR